MLIAFAMSFLLPETSREIDKDAKVLNNYISTSKALFTNFKYIIYILMSSIGIVATYYFVVEAPIIAQGYMKLNSAEYGLWSIVPYV